MVIARDLTSVTVTQGVRDHISLRGHFFLCSLPPAHEWLECNLHNGALCQLHQADSEKLTLLMGEENLLSSTYPAVSVFPLVI